ncbi:MAG: aspartyl protease family protein [Planctomycetota bacterium]
MERQGAMGRFTATMVVANNQDVQMARGGASSPDKIRSVTIDGVVDSGAANLVLPRRIAQQLGLNVVGQAKVRYAGQRRAKRQLVEEVRVEILGRHGAFQALVEPARETALIGAIVLEALDLVVDCTIQKLRPRDPRGIVAEIE